MQTIASSVWQRRGSSIIFDTSSLGSLISEGAVVSLRQALSWSNNIPDTPPVPGATILISGLETFVETLEPQAVNNFLAHQIRPFIIHLQNHWDNCGLVFAFSKPAHAFRETPLNESVLFHRQDQQTVELTEGLWGGGTTIDIRRIICESGQPVKEITVGYYVARIS